MQVSDLWGCMYKLQNSKSIICRWSHFNVKFFFKTYVSQSLIQGAKLWEKIIQASVMETQNLGLPGSWFLQGFQSETLVKNSFPAVILAGKPVISHSVKVNDRKSKVILG